MVGQLVEVLGPLAESETLWEGSLVVHHPCGEVSLASLLEDQCEEG